MALVSPQFTYSHQRLPGLDLSQFAHFFDQLVPDQHISGNYRLRRYSRFNGQLKKLQHKSFFQSKTINYLNGGVNREFEALENALLQLPQFEQLIQTVGHFFGYNPKKTTIGVHQIRVLCSSDETGQPVPEGIHQDGFDLIAMCCVAKHNVSGAESQIFTDPEAPPVYRCTMEPGDIIYCNDRNLYHYASPVEPANKGLIGYRDMFVITVSLDGQQWQETTDSISTTSGDSFQPLPA